MVDRRAKASRRIRIAAACSTAFALALACGPGSIGDLTSGSQRDAGSDAEVDRCPDRVVPPGPPTTPDGPSIPNIIFAVDDLRSDTNESSSPLPKPTGFDLDHTCSGVESPSCTPPTADAAPPPSDPQGRDNAGGPLLSDISLLIPEFQSLGAKRDIARGNYSLLIVLGEWNGTDDDPKVSVSAMLSPGTRRLPDGGAFIPRFDGNDPWDVDSNAVDASGITTDRDCAVFNCIGNTDENAYVKKGELIAHLSAIRIGFAAAEGRLTLPFTGAVLVGQLSKGADGVPRIVGQIAGRMPTTTLVAAMGGLKDPTSLKELCSVPEIYGLVRRTVCASADLAATPDLDRTGARCAALSNAFTFSGVGAQFGVVRPSISGPPGCVPLADPCTNF